MVRASVLACLCTGLVAAISWAQPKKIEKPQLLRLRVTEPYLSLEVESDEQATRLGGVDAGDTTHDQILDITPSVGLTLSGSVGHPDLLSFSLQTEYGRTWGEREWDDGEGVRRDDRDFELQRYYASITLLREKPYAINLYGSRSRDLRDFGDYQSYITEMESEGVRLQYARGLLPWSLSASQSDERVDDPDRPSRRQEETVTFQADNHRDERGRTSLRLATTDFRQEDFDRVTNEGTSRSAALNDESALGPSLRVRLYSSLNYNELEATQLDQVSYSAREELRIRLSDAWSAEVGYLFDERDTSDTDSTRHTADAYLVHQWRDILTSRWGGEAQWYNTRGEGVDEDLYHIGPRLEEHLTQPLGSWGRLRVNLAYDYFRESQTAAGDRIVVVGEKVRLTDGQVALLSQPNADASSIVVSSSDGTTLYQEGLDYRIVQRDGSTELQRVFGGRIANGETVSVDYTAASKASGSVDTEDHNDSAELELFDQRLVLYARRREVNTVGGDSLTFEEFADSAVGARFNWGVLSLGAEQQEYGSSFLSYRAYRFNQQMTLPLGEGTSLTLEASQSRTDYRNVDDLRDVDTYSARYYLQATRRLRLELLGGLYRERGTVSDHDVTTAGLNMDYKLRQLETRLTYKYENEDTSGEERERHWLYLQAKRRF